ncbi:MAG: vWA domain-containing protein, partial [Gammaproteobacteria bacterium]|nr:vWA domain-containing protein [Gammaproteobacteria bacterium]
NLNFPHKFVDTTNASITVSYDPPGTDHFDCSPGIPQVLTPGLLTDDDPNNDGPDRAHHGYTHPFAQDEWSYLPDQQIDLTGVHTEGDFSNPDFDNMPEPQFHFIGADVLSPGIILLLDRSGSMQVETNGVSAAQFVQEAGLYLYHSTPTGEFVGAYVYNANVNPLYPYAEYDPTFVLPNDPGQPPQLDPDGATNIALALETAIDAFVAEHGEGGANGGQIYLMSDGKQTVGNDLFDQVERAEQLGIKIHTFTYGNADAATMAQISSSTSGDDTAMSENEHGSELKLGMAKQFSLLRGNTPVYSFKGKLAKTGVSGGQEYFQTTFQMPPAVQNLRFYAFQADGNASELDIRLKDNNGQSHQVVASQLTNKGRFAGTRIGAPQPGKWTIRVSADEKRGGLPEDAVEIVAYADDRSLDGRAWFKSGQNFVARKMQLRAFLNYQYPLTNMKVLAHLYRDGKRVAKVRMYDDGERGGDHDRADGVYSAELDMRRLQRKLGLRWLKTRQGIQNPKVR